MQNTVSTLSKPLLIMAWLTTCLYNILGPGIQMSAAIALALLAGDVVFGGTYMLSALICPVWFILSTMKNAVERPGWRLALLRIAIPALTLAVVLANNSLQWRIAEANSTEIIAACEAFHAANGTYPKTLGELVPRYMASVPRAKYCLIFGEFVYFPEQPMLMWYAIPPYGREIYNFEERRWSYLD
jgi:hypothetical protein